MIQDTSQLAYIDIQQDGTAKGRKALILTAFRVFGNMTNSEVAERLKLPINCVTGRTNDLVKERLIKNVGSIMAKTGKPNIVWGLA
jgi:predicted ArsR family transcriptional regulator